jgi:predicted dienelactone hydrolase
MERMKSVRCAGAISARYATVVVLLSLVACGPAATQATRAPEPDLQPTAATLPATAPVPPPTATTPQPSAATSTATAPPATAAVVPATPQPAAFPLAEPGLYGVGKRRILYQDATRNDREVRVTVWYPAVAEGENGAAREPAMDVAPDTSGAPYPLLLSSTVVAEILAPYLVSHGFTWASVDIINTYRKFCDKSINQPLDIRFALDQVASSPPEGLEGVIDADHAGAIGYSFDGFNTLALSGARVDPAYYRAQCPTPDATTAAIVSDLSAFDCAPAAAWDDFAALAGKTITTSEDGLWQPMTDERIRAVMPLAAEGWWLFGARGLAAVDRPALMLDATEDELYPENVLIFDHLGTRDKALISFIGSDHMMIFLEKHIARIAHFATAFFGYHLQGRAELADYFSAEFVAQHDDLAWGAYVGK